MKAFLCDKCGEFVRGAPSEVVGDTDASVYLNVKVFQKGESVKHEPDLCRPCRIAAMDAVRKDLDNVG